MNFVNARWHDICGLFLVTFGLLVVIIVKDREIGLMLVGSGIAILNPRTANNAPKKEEETKTS